MCADALKRCAVDFTLNAGSEQRAEVRGDFSDTGWATGVAMTKIGNTARERRRAVGPAGAKFVLDGTNWRSTRRTRRPRARAA